MWAVNLLTTVSKWKLNSMRAMCYWIVKMRNQLKSNPITVWVVMNCFRSRPSWSFSRWGQAGGALLLECTIHIQKGVRTSHTVVSSSKVTIWTERRRRNWPSGVQPEFSCLQRYCQLLSKANHFQIQAANLTHRHKIDIIFFTTLSETKLISGSINMFKL